MVNNDLFISVRNLSSIDKKQKVLFKSRLALIKELAYTICGGGQATTEEIQEIYTSAFSIEGSKATKDIEKYFDMISIADKIDVLKEISNLIPENDLLYESVLGAPEAHNDCASHNIAYVKNHFTDSAYLAFSKGLSCSCSFFNSFDSACQDVLSGESEFCILPIETSHDGKLFSFYAMIDRYELKILSTHTVKHQDASKFTKFALLGRSIGLPQNIDPVGQKLELRIAQPPDKTSPIHEILLAAEHCNIKLFRIDSLPLSYNESMLSYYAVFDIQESELKAFITYLAIEHPQCYAMGIYCEN